MTVAVFARGAPARYVEVADDPDPVAVAAITADLAAAALAVETARTEQLAALAVVRAKFPVEFAAAVSKATAVAPASEQP